MRSQLKCQYFHFLRFDNLMSHAVLRDPNPFMNDLISRIDIGSNGWLERKSFSA